MFIVAKVQVIQGGKQQAWRSDLQNWQKMRMPSL